MVFEDDIIIYLEIQRESVGKLLEPHSVMPNKEINSGKKDI